MKKKIVRIIIGVLVVLGVTVGGIFLSGRQDEILSPLGWGQVEEKKEVKVIGFLASWMVKKDIKIAKELDEVIFLGLEVGEDGSLVENDDMRIMKGERFGQIKKEIKKKKKKLILGIKQFDDEVLDKLLEKLENRTKLVDEILRITKQYGFDGVNLDMEYQNDPLAILREEYFDVINKLKIAGVEEVSVDVFCNTIVKGETEKLKRLYGVSDMVIAMGYDFHYPGVDYGGSVAPVGAEMGQSSIGRTIERIESLEIDKKRAVMAFPLYGYEWRTIGEEYEAKIKRGWYQMASIRRVKEILESGEYKVYDLRKETCEGQTELKDKELRWCWDNLSQTPWITLKEGKEIRQIYYDDLDSLKIKIDLVKEKELGGWGYWAMGYEGEIGEVWRL